ncbi:MAG: type II secretion system protein GspE, partial [Candidatus Nitrosotenuis sp.]
MEELKELSRRLGFTFIESLPPVEDSAPLVRKVPIGFAKKNELAPVASVNGTVAVLTAKPLNHHALADLRALLGQPIEVRVAAPELVAEFINRAYEITAGTAEDMLGEVGTDSDLESIAHQLEGSADILDTDEEAPIVRLLNS